MATAYISEYKQIIGDAQVAQEPSLLETDQTFTTAQSVTFRTDTQMIRFIADADAFILFSKEGTAATASNAKLVKANTVEYFGVIGGHIVSIYDGTSS